MLKLEFKLMNKKIIKMKKYKKPILTKKKRLSRNQSSLQVHCFNRSIEIFQEPVLVLITGKKTQMHVQPEKSNRCKKKLNRKKHKFKVKYLSHYLYVIRTCNMQHLMCQSLPDRQENGNMALTTNRTSNFQPRL